MRRPGPFWTCAAVTLASAAVSCGFSVAGLFGPGRGNVFAQYAASRSVALPLAVLVAMFARSPAAIAALALTMGVVQGFDGLIGLQLHDPFETFGPFVLSAATFVTLAVMVRAERG